jgi:chromosomal replication initiator protein
MEFTWDALKESAFAHEMITKEELGVVLEQVSYVSHEKNTFYIRAGNFFIGSYITGEGLGERLQRHAFEQFGVLCSIDVTIEKVSTPPAHTAHEPPPSPSFQSGVNTKQTFDNFIVGGCNKLANAGAKAVVNSPAKNYNPLYIYGTSGLGKTHLMHAIANACIANDPDFKVIYVTAEEFLNELVQSISTKKMEQFREKYRRHAKLLLIDDIQFWGGKVQTQEEFFHTFNALKKADCQIVMVSDQEPSKIERLDPRLKTRFEGGLLADMQAPERETLLAILLKKGKEMDLDIPVSLCNEIANQVFGDVRRVEGILKRLKVHNQFSNEPLTVESVRLLMPELFQRPKPKEVLVSEIIEAVSKIYSVSSKDLLGKKRSQKIMAPRHTAMLLTRALTASSFPEMGDVFKRDHSSIQHAVKKMKKLYLSNPDKATEIELVGEHLGIPKQTISIWINK